MYNTFGNEIRSYKPINPHSGAPEFALSRKRLHVGRINGTFFLV